MCSSDLHLATEAWVRDVLGQRRGVNVTTRDGDLAEEVTRIIRSLEGADLIVLGGQTGHNAELVTSLVIETKTAVLIGRGATSTETILAATNLERKECPELRSAARLTPQIDGELMAIHNVPPAYFTPERMWTLGVTPDVVQQACASKLEHAAARIGVPIEAVVCSESETKVAILSRARERDVDVIVIGLQCDQASDEGHPHALVREILQEAQRSVLVTPVIQSRRVPAS